jgi:methyl-accepting chemotaxis protein
MPLRLSIATRMALGLLTLGVVAIGGAGTTYFVMDAQAGRVQQLAQAEEGRQLVERLRGGVYAVVMESRGLYIARDKAQTNGFAANLRGHLAQVASDWRKLHDVLPVELQAQAANLDAAMTGFVTLRTDLARVGVEEGTQAADRLGNNDANRAARQVFSQGLDQLATVTATTADDLEANTIAEGRQLASILLAVITAAVTVALAVILWLQRRSVSVPLQRLAAALAKMADGQFDDIVLPAPNHDEIGSITAAAQVFLEKLVRNRELEAAAQAARAARDRQAAAMDSHTQDFGASISGVMTSLGQSAGKMKLAADDMSVAAIRTRNSTSNAAEGANASARDLNAVSVAAEQMAASIHEISRQVAHVTTAVHSAVARASDTNVKVTELAAAADRIGDVVRLISEIAGQTNLLALNATIEAARAGEAGKGFAVVAGEVKALATQTARATEQIGTQIVAIRQATEEAVGAVHQVGVAISQVESVATAIAAAVQQQAAATQEISSSVQSVTMATTTSAQAMEQVLTVAEQTDTASQSVLIAAEQVGQTAATLRVEVNDFLSAIKRGGNDDRRAYERVPGAGASATLIRPGFADTNAEIRDIARGGVAFMCSDIAQPGAEVTVRLPAGGSVLGRVVRSADRIVTIAFRQDAASLALVDHAVEAIRTRSNAAAA